MPHYKVTYFDMRGRGEFVKLVLVAAGQKFEDERVPFQEWPKLKPSTTWGSMPVLEVDGKPLAQTSAIVRFLGHRYGLIPSGDWEAGLVDSVVEIGFDLFANSLEKMANQKATPEDKAAIFKALGGEIMPARLSALEKFIADHGSHGHCVGSKLTTADISLFCGLDFALGVLQSTTILDQYPHVKKVYEKVRNNERIAAYLKVRK